MELKGKKVNFLGDSITDGAGSSCAAARYPDILAGLAELGEIRNYGIGGTRIALYHGQPEEERLDYCKRFPTMDDDADLIIVFGGTNDYGHGNAPMGTNEDRTPETFYGGLHYLMSGLINKYPTADIVILTPIQREGGDKPNAYGYTLDMFVDAIKDVAAQYSLPLLDLYNHGGFCPNIQVQKDAICPDGLHPNDAGYVKLANRIYSYLKTI